MADTDVAQHIVTTNRLLGRLPENEMVRLSPLFERIEITPRQILHHWNLPMDHVYFVESGLVSVMAKTSDREWGEVWLIGSDGMTGIPIVLGDIHPATPMVQNLPRCYFYTLEQRREAHHFVFWQSAEKTIRCNNVLGDICVGHSVTCT